jgi:glyoxylase-like metal-dependent hydrolase (beta-lactamase superfamily II)
MVLLLDGYAITGDTLFVGAVGRTDFPGGSAEAMFDSLRKKICALPDETVVLPGHNYGDTPTSTIGREKQFNPFLS